MHRGGALPPNTLQGNAWHGDTVRDGVPSGKAPRWSRFLGGTQVLWRAPAKESSPFLPAASELFPFPRRKALGGARLAGRNPPVWRLLLIKAGAYENPEFSLKQS